MDGGLFGGGLFGGGLFGGGLFGGGLFVGGLFAGGLFPGRPFWSYPYVSWSYVLQSSDGCQLNIISLNKCYYGIKINPLGIWGPGGLVVLTSCVYRLRKFLILSLELPHLV